MLSFPKIPSGLDFRGYDWDTWRGLHLCSACAGGRMDPWHHRADDWSRSHLSRSSCRGTYRNHRLAYCLCRYAVLCNFGVPAGAHGSFAALGACRIGALAQFFWARGCSWAPRTNSSSSSSQVQLRRQDLAMQPGALVHLPANTVHGFRYGAGGGEVLKLSDRAASPQRCLLQVVAPLMAWSE